MSWQINILLKGQIHCCNNDFEHLILLNFIVEKWVSTFSVLNLMGAFGFDFAYVVEIICFCTFH